MLFAPDEVTLTPGLPTLYALFFAIRHMRRATRGSGAIYLRLFRARPCLSAGHTTYVSFRFFRASVFHRIAVARHCSPHDERMSLPRRPSMTPGHYADAPIIYARFIIAPRYVAKATGAGAA